MNCPRCGKDTHGGNRIADLKQQLAESQAREARLREALTVAINHYADVGSEHWNMFDQTLALPPDDTALKEYRDAVIEECAVIAGNSCLVPPDGGAPTVEEAAVSEEAARRILKLKSCTNDWCSDGYPGPGETMTLQCVLCGEEQQAVASV